MNQKIISKEDAANLIQDETTICTVGMTLVSSAESILSSIEERFIQTHHPRNLTLVHAAGQSDRNRGIQHFAHPGLVKKIIGSHWGLAPRWMAMISDNQVEAYCLPQGQMVHLYSAMAAGLPGRLSQVGLGTFIDPRIEGGRMNQATKEDIVEIVKLRGNEYIYYPEIPLDYLIIRGTSADPKGNLTTDEEAMKLEVLPAVLAAKRFGAKVIVQVKYLVESGSLDPKSVIVPGEFIDHIVICDEPEHDHRQTSTTFYDPSYCGKIKTQVPDNDVKTPLDIRKIIGKRAAKFIQSGNIINLGTGIPNDVIGQVIKEEKRADDVTITIESGIYGGQQEGGIDFGIGQNLSAMISHQDQMLYYNGAGVDITFMGAGELDQSGNVNATKLGKQCTGAGGFIDITQNARHVVFCSTFTAKGLEIEVNNQQLKINQEGRIIKLVNAVNQISYSSEFGKKINQKMHFVTERAVFEMTEQGLMLIEIAPGIDLEKDILPFMAFKPLISESLKVMDSTIFTQ
ncbi:3-oxoacid CoA-transferase [Photobacterium sp. GJ3]|uniref:acyl CoA:acetate/3-ketoacid CoA transferase n=1 Tax=Photobacterium sp. GJ3 TaxID=2829502 RepID=UPI001B8D29B1|nr:CoA-transferase [Photobacterium sp. GJ3]QUJ67972.1 3-oxoacid CoA-transferase [Photobacterium sp. GJ3]